MKASRWIMLGAVISLTLPVPHTASAGPYADEMAKCLVSSTSEADKNSLVKWMFAAVTLHPAVSSISSVSDAQRDELNRKTGKMIERLLTESCKTQVQQAVKYEGSNTIESAFQVLGQVAARGLFTDPSVAGFMSKLGDYVDKKKIETVMGVVR